MANVSSPSSVPNQYMSGRGNYWQVMPYNRPAPQKPGLMAQRFIRGTKDIDMKVEAIVADDFPSLALALEKFETSEAQKKDQPIDSGMTNTQSSDKMADSTKLMLAGLGIGVLGIGAYFMMRKSSEPSTVRYRSSRPLAENDDEKERRLRVLDDLEKASERLEMRSPYGMIRHAAARPNYFTDMMHRKPKD